MDKGENKADAIKCPWCEQINTPNMFMAENEHANIRERRCGNCGKILSAYSVKEGNFLESIRKFQN